MQMIGVREMKAHLSGYLEKVKAGELFTITDRGHEVAILVPLRPENPIPFRLVKLMKSGILLGSSRKPQGLRQLIRMKGKLLSKTILEQRESRL
ncbi:MAG: type II toxin-antitoxin system prevent-host-death family antitoxin [Elusimicrobia bacterium]|nr:type II toxin-antitoxin system prevent-host-death family antitoxin [Elusimicrobiota bacterium]